MTKALKSGWGSAGASAIKTGQQHTESKHVTDRQNIAANPLNSRVIDPAADDIRQLAVSLAETQLHAIPVVPLAEFLEWDGYRELYADMLAQLAYVDQQGTAHPVEYVAIGGGRRLTAAAVGNLPRLEISIKKGLSREAFLRLTVVENLERAGLRPLEEARQIKLLRDATGDSYAVLAEKIGRTKGFVIQRLGLLSLAADLQQQIEAGTLRIGVARQLVARIADEIGPGAADDAQVGADRQRELLAEILADLQGVTAVTPETGAPSADLAPAQGFGSAAVEQQPVTAVTPETGSPSATADPRPQPVTAVTPPPRKGGRPRKPAAEKVREALKGETAEAALDGALDAFAPSRIAAGMARKHRTALAYPGQPVAEVLENYEQAGFTAAQFAELGAAMIERSKR